MITQKKKVIAGLAAIIALCGILISISVANDRQDEKSDTQTTASVKKEEQLQVEYQGQDGQNALSLLKTNYNVETKSYEGLGELVTNINGVVPDSKHFWAFYVNEKQSQVGASQYETKSSDVLTWKLEKITQ